MAIAPFNAIAKTLTAQSVEGRLLEGGDGGFAASTHDAYDTVDRSTFTYEGGYGAWALLGT